MIQFNLLPDVKIEYIKAMRTKRMVMGVSILVTLTTLVVCLLMVTVVYGIQPQTTKGLNSKIADYSNQLKKTPDLDKILTIQNQLDSLTSLHEQKVAASRIFGFIQQFTPAQVTISDFTVDFTENTMSLTGASPTLDKVNTFTDTLKYSNYNDGGNSAGKKAFSDVVLAQFGKSNENTSYTITLSFDPALFDNKVFTGLVIPKGISTNSVTGQPAADIFKQAPQTTNGQTN